MNSSNVIENAHEYKYNCEKCGKECSYGMMIYQQIVKNNILHVCKECYDETTN